MILKNEFNFMKSQKLVTYVYYFILLKIFLFLIYILSQTKKNYKRR